MINRAWVENLIRARQGPLTSELVQRPGDFGLGRVPARLAPAGTTTMICGFCSTGCSLKIHLDRDGRAINLTPDPAHPVNLGMACPKGWEALTPLAAPDRATTPLLRDPSTGVLTPVPWTRAVEAFCERMRDVQGRHGPASVGVLSTGQIVMEEMALLGAFAKFGMGVADIDSNTRQCMATSHVAYKQSFGFDAPPFTYADFEESDALVFIGANPCIAHPIMWQRVMRNRRSPEIIVVDPRRTETAMCATRHLALRPRSDLVLLYGLAALLVERGWIRRDFIDAHTTGFDEFAAFLRQYPLDRIVRETGLTAAEISGLAGIMGKRERVSLWWTMGVNQGHEATRTAQAIINLALMTGNIGRPGTGANSITGQCNAMGSRLFGNATSLLGGHDFAAPAHRAKISRVLGIDEAVIPARASRAYDQILDAVEAGEIRALWIIATNTAHSWVNQGRFGSLRDKLDFLVVQDMYATTETARMADLVLPAAGWGEKEGVLINSERRLGLVRKVARAPGQALGDFTIFKLLAEAWGCGPMFREWRSPEATFAILRELSRGQPCDFTGIRDYAHIESSGGIQWPFPDSAPHASDDSCRAGSPNPASPVPHPSPSPSGLQSTDDSCRAGSPNPASPVPHPSPSLSGLQSTDDSCRAGSPNPAAPVPHPSPSLSGLQSTDDSCRAGSPNPASPASASALQPFSPSAFQSISPSAPSERRLFSDGRFFTPDGRARFWFDEPRPQPEPPDSEYPFILLTGRGSSAQWHTGTRTDKSDVLRKLAPTELYVEVNPDDAASLGIADGERISVRSRRGLAEAQALVTPIVQPGHVFMPMHFAQVNRLTFPAFDPHSRQPAYKACAVTLDRLPARTT